MGQVSGTATVPDFRELIENAPEAVSVFDGRRLCYANPAAVRLFGYESAEDIASLPWTALVHPDDRAILEERARQIAMTGQSLEPVAYRLLRKDGSSLLVEVSSAPILWAGQRAVLSCGRDISARKALEAKQAQTQRLASLGTMLAGIAHELNNPLTYALLALEHVREALAEGVVDEARGSLEELGTGLSRIETLVRRLRAFSREDGRSPTAVSLPEVWAAAARLTSSLVRHRGSLAEDIEPVANVIGSAPRFQQLMVTLVSFAVQRMPEGHEGNEIRVAMRNLDAQHVIIEVSDNGASIPAAQLPRLFDPFATLGPFVPVAAMTSGSEGTSYSGPSNLTHSLSLAMCHEIVVEAGGTIAVESEPGSSTTFRITLPSMALAEAAPAHEPPKAKVLASRHRLLIVDDEALIGDLLRRVLNRDFEVEVLVSGREAVERLTQTSAPDVVLCDVMMPGLSGVDVYHAVVARHASLGSRFVFMTGGSIHDDLSAFLASSGRPCVEKPFDLAHLVRTVSAVARQATGG
jgi:PAS domain S-box-containing protein